MKDIDRVFTQVGIPEKIETKPTLSGSAHFYGHTSRVDAGHDRTAQLHKDSDHQGEKLH